MQHLYFCRHGESELNAAGLLAGATETPLTERGRNQALASGQYIQELDIDYIVCSPQSRAHETAQIIAGSIGYDLARIETNRLFVERNFGELEGKIWKPLFSEDEMRSAETLATIEARARQAYEYLQSLPYDTILVVSHSSFGRALRHVISPDIPHHGSPRFENAQIVKLV